VFPFLVGHRYIELFLRSQPDMEDVSGRGWAGSESGGQNFGSGNSGGKKMKRSCFGFAFESCFAMITLLVSFTVIKQLNEYFC